MVDPIQTTRDAAEVIWQDALDTYSRNAAVLVIHRAIAQAEQRGHAQGAAERAELVAEVGRLTAEVARLKEPHWFYLGNDCSSDQCRFGIHEIISEDFEWDNKPEGDHVMQIAGARPVPDIWVAVHYFTEAEKDARDDDEPYTFTEHATEAEARAALSPPRVREADEHQEDV